MPEVITRRGWLLNEIRTLGGVWNAQRAENTLRQSPWPTSGRNTARKDLRALHQRGNLTQHFNKEKQRHTYTAALLSRRAA